MGLNQPKPLQDYNLFTSDQVLTEAVQRDACWAAPRIREYGRLVGSAEVTQWAFQANENPPLLRTHDRYGERIDEVEFHPAWHNLMRISVENGLHNLPWAEPAKGVYPARAALMLLMSQIEQGHTCPISMTCAAVPTLRLEPELPAAWESRLRSLIYDPRSQPAQEKVGLLIGMGMTEKQGGSDVRANITRAERDGEGYRITGHKWFCSAPMCDAFLVLAQAPAGLTCFLLPRWHDGQRNGFRLQRLKSKLGNRSNASSEVEFERAWAWRIAEEGRGVPAIIEMVQHTRLDCVTGSAGLMRQALVQAIHHCRGRSAFGRLLIDQPLMQAVLADLAIESEAATLLTMRLARAFEQERPFARLATAAAKYWVCKRAPWVVSECLECLGGNGYVEESVLPRLYREAPLNSIWEGSGNVICLDIQRTIHKEPESLEAFLAELGSSRGHDVRLDTLVDSLEVQTRSRDESEARRLAENLALALQASLLIRYSPDYIWKAFCRARLEGQGGKTFGTLPPGVERRKIIDRAFS